MDFSEGCEKAKIPETKRQARKFKNKRGAAWRMTQGLPLSDVFKKGEPRRRGPPSKRRSR